MSPIDPIDPYDPPPGDVTGRGGSARNTVTLALALERVITLVLSVSGAATVEGRST